MEKKYYYNVPTQVFWKNPYFGDTDSIYNETEYFVGIAYKDEIICACCGVVFHVDEVPEILEFEYWSNIAEDITGGITPEQLKKEIENVGSQSL